MKKGILAVLGFTLALLVMRVFVFSMDKPMVNPAEKYSDVDSYTRALEIPTDLAFAGESIPTEMFDVAERLDKELLVNANWHSQTILLYKKAKRWFPVIEPILKKNNVPDDFKYLALAESGLSNVVSPAGATGYWQFLQPAGKKYGLEISDNVDERYHLEKSTEAACKYLIEAKREFASWIMAAASYNMGIQGLKNQVNNQRQTSYFDLYLNDETSRYIFRLVALKEVFSNPEKYKYKISKKYWYPTIPVNEVTVDSSITSLVDFAESKGINYKILKMFNPWLRQTSLQNKDKKSYSIKIPDPGFNYRRYIERMAAEDSLDRLVEGK